MKKILIPLMIVLLVVSGCTANNSTETSQTNSADTSILYVNANSSGGDGSSWDNAFTTLTEALTAAVAGNEIWVASGTYYPTDDGDTSKSFQMLDDVNVYGGFDGTEASTDDRDWVNNSTILSGDLGVIGVSDDNSVKVVIAANALIDGFTISDGYFTQSMSGPPSDVSAQTDSTSDMPPMDEAGDDTMATEESSGASSTGHSSPDQVMDGDASSSSNGNGLNIWGVAPTIKNCVITNNEGGKGAGVYIMGTGDLDELPTFINTTISYNIAGGRGGGVSIDMMSQALFVDCIFDSNECTQGKGGAIYNDFGGSPLFENCLFINNYAQSGAALGNDGVSNPVISNTTFYNNTASEAGAVLYQGTGPFNDPIVIDTVMWNNICEQDKVSVYNWNECDPKIDYSIVQDGYEGVGVLDVDPMFVDADSMNFEYDASSPALSAGSDGGAIGFSASAIANRTEEEYDEILAYLYSLDGNDEIKAMDLTYSVDDSLVGAIGDVVYVDEDAMGSNDGSSFANAFTSIQTGIDYANASYLENDSSVEVWVAEGIYASGYERSDSIVLRTGVNVFGGFNGRETSKDQRDFEKNPTILSGEIGDKNTVSDNSYHVLIGADDAVLDGFTITGGYADGIDGEIYDNKGGGLINYLGGNRVRPDEEPTLGFDIIINNCTFENNYADEGGASYTYHGGNPEYNNCAFVENTAEYGGAVLDRAGTNAIYTECTFSSNEALYKGGAAFTDYGAMSTFYDSVFTDNKSATAGGAIYVIDRASQAVPNETDFDLIDPTWSSMTDIYSSVYLDTCIFSDNQAGTEGGALYVYDGGFAKIIDSDFSNHSASDAALTASESGTIILDDLTTFNNNSPQDVTSDGGRSAIVYE